MKYLCTFLFLILWVCSTSAYSAETQTNVSGSNTSIEGGYTGGATTYESGSESTSTTNSTSNSNIRSAPPTAGAPSYNSMTQDVCAVGASMQEYKHLVWAFQVENILLTKIVND